MTAQPGEPKEFMSTEEVAEWLGVPVYTVTREAREGRLPARKVGRGWRFSRSAILDHFRGSDAAPGTGTFGNEPDATAS